MHHNNFEIYQEDSLPNSGHTIFYGMLDGQSDESALAIVQDGFSFDAPWNATLTRIEQYDKNNNLILSKKIDASPLPIEDDVFWKLTEENAKDLAFYKNLCRRWEILYYVVFVQAAAFLATLLIRG